MTNNTFQELELTQTSLVLSPEQLLEHWQGHRRLTRKLIEIFPEDKFFDYSIGGMRTCAGLVKELISLSGLGINGIVTANWDVSDDLRKYTEEAIPTTKKEIICLWDEVTTELEYSWKNIPPSRFQEMDAAFNMYEGSIYWIILYFIDNEIHHRAQAYVYLRSLGIEPPPFWDRS